MRIAVIGAGGVGAPFGAALHRAGADVWFLARGNHLATMRTAGLRITGARGDLHLTNVNATDQPTEIGSVAVVLLAVKLWDVKKTARALSPVIAPDTVVVTLQNGVDAPRRVANTIGDAHVAAGSCFVNAAVVEPGVIVQRNASQRIVAGMLNGTTSDVLERFGTTCGRSDIDFALTHTPLDSLWEKFIQLVPISATTALLRQPIGVVRRGRESWNMFLQILNEAVLVGRATGAHIPPETVARRLAYVGELPYDATSSMATDLLQGRRLELPWLSGRISALGRRHGIPTPANDFVVVALKPFVFGNQRRAEKQH